MLSQPPLWLIILAFICAIGPLVFIHEMGHYLVGRLFGVGAETFSIGFGREVTGWTDKRGTRWKVGWLPLGGYVRFVGDANARQRRRRTGASAQRSDSFAGKPVWQRFLVVLAGPMANFLLAILIFAGFLRRLRHSADAECGRAAAAGRRGRRPRESGPATGSTAIAGQRTGSFEDVQRIVSLRPGEQVTIRIVRDGPAAGASATPRGA